MRVRKRTKEQRQKENRLYRQKHKKRLDEYNAAYRAAHPSTKPKRLPAIPLTKEQLQARSRQFKYKITEEQYNARLVKQKHLCAICKQPLDVGKRTHLDHDHTTNVNRDILCGHCNVGLGFFKHNIETLKAAIEYLQKWS